MNNKKLRVPPETLTQTQTSSDNRLNGSGCQPRTGRVREESAVITLSGSQIESVQALPLITGHSDHTLKQVWRDETHAVYKHFGYYGQFIGWESILIKVAPARRIFGKDYPDREVYPSHEDFGRYALSVGAQYDKEYAIQKAKTLSTRCRRKDRQNPTGSSWETMEHEQTDTNQKLKLEQTKTQ